MPKKRPLKANVCQNCDQETVALHRMPAKVFRKNVLRKNTGDIDVCPLCKDCFEKRKACLEEILNSDSAKKLIVAGPGTGKTFTFGEILKGIPLKKKAIVFTLINNLVEDLLAELGPTTHDGIKITTFHGFCRELLHSKVQAEGITKNFSYFPSLPVLISSDAFLSGEDFTDKDFSKAFAQIDEDEAMDFYLDRATYYDAVAHADSVYRVFRFYESNPSLIPQFEIVIGDEYQDFNRLEAAFIGLLSEKNKVLLAGDDDQALYAFRGSSTEFIRTLHADPTYSNFSLPFCSRCSQAIVDATTHFVKKAQELGFLQDRLDRTYECYWPDKYEASKQYEKIDLAKCSKFDPTALKLIQTRIEGLVDKEGLTEKTPGIPFLIIGPESGYHLDQVYKYLSEKLDPELYEVRDGRRERIDLEIEEGYFILKKDGHSNLGWRIVLHCDPLPDVEDIIKKSVVHRFPLEELLPDDYKAKHLSLIGSKRTKEEVTESESTPQKRILILLTNFFGSKGLSAEHCIIIGLSNGVFPRDPKDVDDTDACKFLVALTRAKRSCLLVTNREFDKTKKISAYKPSGFISLIHKNLLSKKEYSIKKGVLVSK